MKICKRKLGPVEQKILILLAAGLALGLSGRPDQYFRIVKSVTKEWRKINQRSLREAIRRLHQSHMINFRENIDGTITIDLEDDGKKASLRYNLDKLKITKPDKWDGFWRMVIFDIPEFKKKGRDALAIKLKQMGFLAIQKSVFIYPYDCRKEIEFVSEVFEVKPYVRFIIVKDIDIELDLKQKFNLN